MEDEEHFRVRNEERNLVREQDVVASMEYILRERLALEKQRHQYEERRDQTSRAAMVL